MKKYYLCLLPCALLVACGEPEIRTYEVPKDSTPPPVPATVTQPPPPVSPAASAPATDGLIRGELKVSAPAGWQQVEPGRMVLAKWQASGGKAEVSISSFPGDVGGLLPNINRWRRQIGLPPTDAPETETLQYADGSATYVYMTNGDQALAAAIVPRGPNTWFFKHLGEVQAVEADQAAFRKFVKTLQFVR